MTSRERLGKIVPAMVTAVVVLLLLPERAHAQFGFGGGGFGLGWGFGMFRPVPTPESFLYSKALVDAGRGSQFPSSREIYANNPNSYINHVRDNGFVDRYPVERREMPQYRYPPPARAVASAAPVAATTTAAVAPEPALPLSSFYGANHVLVWPGEAPTAGELKEKRAIFDKASDLVLSETTKNGVASMASVTDARQKLLDYGRPALSYTRAVDTPRISDTFHMFLLSLYESLAQAANPVTPPAAPAVAH
jgi:hypothetical protein